MRAPYAWSLGLAGLVFGPSCAERSFTRLVPDEDLELAALVEGPSGEILDSTPFVAPGEVLEVELPAAPEVTVWVVGLAPADLEAMNPAAAPLGLDPTRLRRSERVTRAEGCAATYPSPRRTWRLEDDTLKARDGESFAIGAPWLDTFCRREPPPPPPGFVSSEVILSSCSLCPATQMQRVGPCSAVLRHSPNVCGFEPAETALRFDWRDRVCAEPGGECRSIGSRLLRCGDDPGACELEVHVDGLRAEDAFVSFDSVVAETSTAGAWVWGFIVTNSRLVRGLRARTPCAEDSGGWARLETWTLDGERTNEHVMSGCDHALHGPREGDVFLTKHATNDGKGVWRFEERGEDGEVEARLELDLESVLGLGSLERLYFASTIWWPDRQSWVLLPAFLEREQIAPMLLLHREGDALVLTQGAPFHFPEGVANTIIRTNPDGTSALWIVSGGNLAVVESPEREVVYRSVMPSVIGSTDPVRPATDRLGRLGDHVWSTGRWGPTATTWRVEADGGPVAYLSEISGRAEFLAQDADQILVFSHNGDGVFATRFDPDTWRFRPGTIRVAEVQLEMGFTFDSIAQRTGGPTFIIGVDGSITRVDGRR